MFLPTLFIFSLVFSIDKITERQKNIDSFNKHISDMHALYLESGLSRKEVLEKFFEKYNSPLEENAQTFVEIADLYGIDYRILPAIACIESTCGKNIIEGSYNPFGWGIYGTNYIAFSSFDEAIKTVGEGLNKGYFSNGLDTVEEIALVYTPSNSYHWASNVKQFMYEMDSIREKETIRELVFNDIL